MIDRVTDALCEYNLRTRGIMTKKRIDDLNDGESAQVERVVSSVEPPPEGKKAMRVFCKDDPHTYLTQRAFQLVNPGDRLLLTIKASVFHGVTYYWIDDWSRIQKEELSL